jgi:hypothetical protein
MHDLNYLTDRAPIYMVREPVAGSTAFPGLDRLEFVHQTMQQSVEPACALRIASPQNCARLRHATSTSPASASFCSASGSSTTVCSLEAVNGFNAE